MEKIIQQTKQKSVDLTNKANVDLLMSQDSGQGVLVPFLNQVSIVFPFKTLKEAETFFKKLKETGVK